MLHHQNTKNPKNIHSNTSSFNSLLAFKPRQVLLAHHNININPTTTTSASMNENINKTLTHEMKDNINLHELILDYLHRNGFSKTLKRFHSEAQIQTDAWKASSLRLEDMFCKNNVCNADGNNSKKPVLGNGEASEKEKVCPANEETINKKKKKKVIVESDDGASNDQSELTCKKIKESSKNLGQISKDITVNEIETQPKRKKIKHDLVLSIEDAVNGSKVDDLTKKNKDKKKKDIEKVKLEQSTTNEDELVTEVAQKEKKKKKKSSTDEIVTIQPDVRKTEKKSSKKRKRSFSDENENFDGETNGKLEIDGLRSKKKQRSVTTEPNTVNAFQRVKIDEVEFAHDKLQDNSYWAKGGAEIGYGAKAQEVLGQVRGRDFRHEKTKKKRGSYRGGLIDQQSHSIKFNYSDEE
ncbi:hypothetical protein M8C21_019900 [Ambrosia artemisiifolia]|uniref:Srp40 C-terminal domain-containing protein n=1 Tax=Ambrosia artemisiifolia TaxID=4212 RepID=A0AAD5BVB0_AMBAR|nr:hypothetical protein M8C21_019900 [Ambrosia artemisiifolia]